MTRSTFFASLLVLWCSLLRLESVECASHDSNAFAVSELHGLLNTTEAGTFENSTAQCPDGKVIVWGYSFMYSQYESNAAFEHKIERVTLEAQPVTLQSASMSVLKVGN
jgi:hypothetical protein